LAVNRIWLKNKTCEHTATINLQIHTESYFSQKNFIQCSIYGISMTRQQLWILIRLTTSMAVQHYQKKKEICLLCGQVTCSYDTYVNVMWQFWMEETKGCLVHL